MELPSTGVPVGLTAQQVQEQAPQRWFNATELCQILANPEILDKLQPQERQKKGAFFAIEVKSRQEFREFRKDGHNWARKKDGKRIQESHMNLKVAGVEKLNCLYAREEPEGNFRRRIYRMIEKKGHGSIALFHYRKDEEIRRYCGSGRKIAKVNPHSSKVNVAVTGSFSGTVDYSGNQSSLPPQTANTSNLNIESGGFADAGNQNSIQANTQLSGSSFGIVNHENYQLPLPPKTTDSSYQSNSQANAESASAIFVVAVSMFVVLLGDGMLYYGRKFENQPFPPETKNDSFTNPAPPNYLPSPATPGSPSGLSDWMEYLELSPERNKENLERGKEIPGELPANSFGEEYQDHMSFQQNPELQKGWNNGKRCKTTNTSNLSNIQASAASGGCVPFEGTEKDFPPRPGMPSIPCEWPEINDLEQFQEFSFPEDSGNYIGDPHSGSIFESLLLPDECFMSNYPT